MKSIVIRVTPELHAALKAKKAETGVPTEVFVRSAINMALYGDRQAQRGSGKRTPILVPSNQKLEPKK